MEKDKWSGILALGLTLVTNPKKKRFAFKRKFLEDLWNEIYQATGCERNILEGAEEKMSAKEKLEGIIKEGMEDRITHALINGEEDIVITETYARRIERTAQAILDAGYHKHKRAGDK